MEVEVDICLIKFCTSTRVECSINSHYVARKFNVVKSEKLEKCWQGQWSMKTQSETWAMKLITIYMHNLSQFNMYITQLKINRWAGSTTFSLVAIWSLKSRLSLCMAICGRRSGHFMTLSLHANIKEGNFASVSFFMHV